MTDPTKPLAPLEGEIEDDHQEASLARQDGGAGVFSITGAAMQQDALAALDRAIAWQGNLRQALLKLSDPADWIAQKTDPPTLMLGHSGAVKFAPFLGIHLRPVPPATDLTPLETQEDGIKAYTVRALMTARAFGIVDREIEATRRSDEDFTGRSLDAEGAFTRKKEERARSYGADVRNSTRSLLITKSVRECGFKRVPASEVQEAWGKAKSLAHVQGGHGFGSADARRAGAVAEEGAAASAEDLWFELLRISGGDTGAASGLLKEITSTPGKFAGFTDPKRMTAGWQVENAWGRLKKHPRYRPAAAPAEREPGEDG